MGHFLHCDKCGSFCFPVIYPNACKHLETTNWLRTSFNLDCLPNQHQNGDCAKCELLYHRNIMKVIKTKPRKAVVHVEVLGGSGQIPVGLHHRDHTRPANGIRAGSGWCDVPLIGLDVQKKKKKIYSLCKIWSQGFQSTIIII